MNKLTNKEDLYSALKFVLRTLGAIPAEFSPGVAKLSVGLKLDLGVLEFGTLLAEIGKSSVTLQMLTKLCYDFMLASRHDEIIAIINNLLTNKRDQEAYELVDYVKENMAKATVLLGCKKYGEAYMFAKAAGDEAMMAKIEGFIFKKSE